MPKAKTHFQQVPLETVVEIVRAQNGLQPAIEQKPEEQKRGKKKPAEVRLAAGKQPWEARS